VPTAIADGLTSAGATMGTVAYMSPEQARGEITDVRTDLFSFGTVLYQMSTGVLPFQGDTSAVVFDSILNRDSAPVNEVNSSLPQELGRIIGQALEKDRDLRFQSATELKTALKRLKRDLDSGRHLNEPSGIRSTQSPNTVREQSIAVLYFENLSGMKEDEYLRDGITEDITTELSKINGLRTFFRANILPYRDKSVTAGQVGKELGASHVLAGSLRRIGNRLRINAQLIDAANEFPLWSERYDREMEDVFAVQDEIASKIAAALRNHTFTAGTRSSCCKAHGKPTRIRSIFTSEEIMRGEWHGRICRSPCRCTRVQSHSIPILQWPTQGWRTYVSNIFIISSGINAGSTAPLPQAKKPALKEAMLPR
jgi:non-specific serine/threonine protein kinase